MAPAPLRGAALRARVAGARALARHRTVRRDCPVSGLAALVGSRRKTHSAACGRCVQTAAASQKWKRAARAALGPALLGVADSPRRAQPAALPWRRWCSPRRPPSLPSRQAAPGRGDLWGAEKRSAAGGVRRAAPDRRGGSMRRRGSAVAEPPQPPRGASIAGQSRAAGPPQCEPLAGAACRDAMALKVRSSRHVSTSAMRRQPPDALGQHSAR